MPKSLDDITPDEFLLLGQMAAAFYTPKQIAIVLEINTTLFVEACSDEESNVYNAYHSSFLKSEFELRSSIVKLAKSGSSPAQTMAMDLLTKSKIKMFES